MFSTARGRECVVKEADANITFVAAFKFYIVIKWTND
jgi:hypothetical protein